MCARPRVRASYTGSVTKSDFSGASTVSTTANFAQPACRFARIFSSRHQEMYALPAVLQFLAPFHPPCAAPSCRYSALCLCMCARVRVAALFFDGRYLITGGSDKTVRVQRNRRSTLQNVSSNLVSLNVSLFLPLSAPLRMLPGVTLTAFLLCMPPLLRSDRALNCATGEC